MALRLSTRLKGLKPAPTPISTYTSTSTSSNFTPISTFTSIPYLITKRLMSTSLKGKNFLCISQLTNSELSGLIDHAIAMKKDFKASDLSQDTRAKSRQPLKGMSMSMIFQKRSTRTRVSTETGMFKLGGHGLMLGPSDIQLGVNETMKDTALVLSRFNDIILARVFAHSDVLELAEESTVPVINALSDKYHPLQTLADLMCLKEHFGELSGKTLSWVGDGNNVLHDLMIGALKSGMNVNVATPSGYEADEDVVELAKRIAEGSGLQLTFTADPIEAVTGSNVVVTDTWVSMGEESEAVQKKIDFAGYQVNADLMAKAAPDAVFLHCLPRKPEEVTDEVIYSKQSLVFPEAENRMWTVMAVTMELLGKHWVKGKKAVNVFQPVPPELVGVVCKGLIKFNAPNTKGKSPFNFIYVTQDGSQNPVGTEESRPEIYFPLSKMIDTNQVKLLRTGFEVEFLVAKDTNGNIYAENAKLTDLGLEQANERGLVP